MPRILSRDGYEFFLDLDINSDEESTLRVSAAIRREPLYQRQREGERTETFTASVSVVARDGEPYLSVEFEVRGKSVEVYAAPLREVVGGDDIVNAIPGHLYGLGDPISGCLVRGGLAAIIDQTKKCWGGYEPDPPGFRERLMRALGCLRENLGNMGMNAAVRAGFCIARGGF